MRQSFEPPRAWAGFGVFDAVVRLAVWVAVVLLASYFIAKYW